MSKKIILSIVMTALFVSGANAGSIWGKRDKNRKHPFTDDVARKIGDVLTIKISEGSKVDNKTKRDLKKETDRSTVFDGKIGNYADIGEFGLIASSSSEMSGQADYKAERSYIDSVTVVVIDILPNSNLIVKGTRNRMIEGDSQVIDISGIVRPSDIDFNNIIESDKVADFQIVVKDGGISAPYTNPGWLGKLLDAIWPF